MCRRGGGSSVGTHEAWGCRLRNCVAWFLHNISAELFAAPGICVAMICISKKAVKNQRHLSRCITMRSLEEPLLIACTRPWLSHCNTVDFFANIGPQTAQPRITGTSFLAIMVPALHSLGYIYIETTIWQRELHNPMTLRHLSGCNNRGCCQRECHGADWDHSNGRQRHTTSEGLNESLCWAWCNRIIL